MCDASTVRRFEERSPRFQRRANRVEKTFGVFILVVGAMFALSLAVGVIAAVVRFLR